MIQRFILFTLPSDSPVLTSTADNDTRTNGTGTSTDQVESRERATLNEHSYCASNKRQPKNCGSYKVPMNNHGRTGAEKREWKQRRAEVQRRAAAIQKANTRSTRVHEPNLARVVAAHIGTTLTTDEYCWRDVNRAPDPEGDLDPEEAPHLSLIHI